MSTDDLPGQKSGHDIDASTDDLPAAWSVAGDDEDALLVHESGAKLIIFRTAPGDLPPIYDPETPTATHGDHYQLDFQPSNREGLVPVVETGTKEGCRREAARFAKVVPDARPDVEMLAAWVTEDQL